MDFYTAMRCVAEGERVKREAWPNGLIHVCLENEHVKLIDQHGKRKLWVITKKDLEATDWVTTAGG